MPHKSITRRPCYKQAGYDFFENLFLTAKGSISMAVERTLSIIKPDATDRNLTGQINSYIEEAGLKIIEQ